MKSKFSLLILIGLIVISFVSLQVINQTKNNSQIQEKKNSNASYQQQIDEKGSVVVAVTPILLTPKNNASFTVTFTTHSGDLDYDILAISTLTDNIGNTFKSISWTGGKGGHHIEGILTFPKLSQGASSVTLIIPGIDNNDRIFEWELN